MQRLARLARANAVPLLFFTVSTVGILMARLDLSRVTCDVLERFGRDAILVLALVIPIVAGLGLNFAIVLGAMAGQVGLMVVQNGGVDGIGGLGLAAATSVPVAILVGFLTGRLFNRARGREMVTGIILAFFAGGGYRFLFLILTGPVIPLHAADVLLPQGMGVRVTIDLTTVERTLDDLLLITLKSDGRFWGELPLATLAAIALVCVAIVWFFRTKLGQDLRATGQDQDVSSVAGIRVKRCRIVAVILSMILAGLGQIVFLQNMTVMNAHSAHEQVGFYAVAAILVGGATVVRATIWNALVGTILFHMLMVVVAVAAQELMHSAQVGEYLREFTIFGIIGTALALHAWKGRRATRG